jgi:hypothetical protein
MTMEKREFLLKVPDIIEHSTRGYGELEVVVDNVNLKCVCYRHRDKTASCGTYAPSWKELYNKLSGYLIKEGYMSNAKV